MRDIRIEDRGIITLGQFFDPETLWMELELAPPKDWIPHCHDGDKEYGCSGSIDHQLHLFPRCVKCPWRSNKYDKCIEGLI